MKSLSLALAVVAFAALGLAWPNPPSRALAAGGLARVELVTAKGRFAFTAEIANDHASRARGLMFRQRLPRDRAMLFDFGKPTAVAMWMHNTLVPLDMIFITAAGRVRSLAENTTPMSKAIIRSSGPVRFVLEVVAGTVARTGLEPGDRVVLPLLPGG